MANTKMGGLKKGSTQTEHTNVGSSGSKNPRNEAATAAGWRPLSLESKVTNLGFEEDHGWNWK